MTKMFLTTLKKTEVNIIRAAWVEQIKEHDDSSLEIVDSYFDNLMTTDDFGDLLERSNQYTYMAVRSELDCEDVIAIASIIFVRQGARTRCKIMDITYAPHIDSMVDDDEFAEATFNILLAVLAQMLSINNVTRHGITKVYARNDSLSNAMELLHSSMNSEILDKIGFTVKKSGRLWLEFEKKSK